MLRNLLEMWRVRAKRDRVYTGAEYWNRKAKEHSGTAVSMFVNRTLNEIYQRDQFRFFDASLGPIESLSGLDLGCGTGRLSRHLAGRGARMTGIDFSVEAIRLAKEQSHGLGIDFRQESIFDLKDIGKYDFATVLACLTVACADREQLREVVNALYRSLRPGGRLVVIEPFHSSFLRRVLRLGLPHVLEDFSKAGFKIEKIDELHFWPTRLILTLGDTPAWITKPVHYMGEGALGLMPFRGLGDYKCIALIRPGE